MKDTVEEGYRGGSGSSSAIEPFGDKCCESAADCPTTMQVIAAIICKVLHAYEHCSRQLRV